MQIVLNSFFKKMVNTSNARRTRLQEYNGIEVKGQVDGFDLAFLSNPCCIEESSVDNPTGVDDSYKGFNYGDILESGTYEEVKTGTKDLTDEAAQALVNGGLATIV